MQPNFGGVGSEIKPTAGAEGETKTPRPRSSLARLKILAQPPTLRKPRPLAFDSSSSCNHWPHWESTSRFGCFLMLQRSHSSTIALPGCALPGSLPGPRGPLPRPSLVRGVDAVFVQREAMLLGPPVVEYLIVRVFKKPMILDLDDATYRYQSPTYGRWAGVLKCFGKTNRPDPLVAGRHLRQSRHRRLR